MCHITILLIMASDMNYNYVDFIDFKAMDIQELIISVLAWLLCEVFLNLAGCDALANYQEFIDGRSHSEKEKVELLANRDVS